jgi:hypothetical protein
VDVTDVGAVLIKFVRGPVQEFLYPQEQSAQKILNRKIRQEIENRTEKIQHALPPTGTKKVAGECGCQPLVRLACAFSLGIESEAKSTDQESVLPRP